MPFFSADYIIPVSSPPIQDGVVHTDDNGTIIHVAPAHNFPSADIKKFNGIILPGFINSHCHLELSHMKGLCNSGTGLINFVGNVVKLRDFDEAVILDAIEQKDREMYNNGIQAVGDICNKTDTFSVKEKSPIHYYSFVELFDMMQPALTDATIAQYSAVYAGQSDRGSNKKSFVPHAPYSVSKGLFEFINKANTVSQCISIHNQETPDENQLFEDGTGGFKSFFEGLGLSLDHFEPIGRGSIHHILAHLEPRKKNIFVHNTLTSEHDILEAHKWSGSCYWASCPNANLYIENRLPDYRVFQASSAKVCLGTDSIMSNWQLSIWEEVKTIRKYNSWIPVETLIQWSTINGAEALDYDDLLGSIQPGKTPGLINIDLDWQGADTVLADSKPVRII